MSMESPIKLWMIHTCNLQKCSAPCNDVKCKGFQWIWQAEFMDGEDIRIATFTSPTTLFLEFKRKKISNYIYMVIPM